MRDLDVGSVYGRVFELYRSQFVPLVVVALIINFISALATFMSGTGGRALVSLVSIILGALYTGMVVRLVQDLQDGRRDSSVGTLLSSVSPVLLPLLVVSFLYGIGVAIGFVLLVVPGLFLLTMWAVATPVTVIERPGILKAFGRSRELVRGHGWTVFGALIIVFLLAAVVGGLAAAIGQGSGTGATFVVTWLLQTLVAPLSALVSAVLYFGLRGDSWSAPQPTAF